MIDGVAPRVAGETDVLVPRVQVGSQRMIVSMIAHSTFLVMTRKISAPLARVRPGRSPTVHVDSREER